MFFYAYLPHSVNKNSAQLLKSYSQPCANGELKPGKENCLLHIVVLPTTNTQFSAPPRLNCPSLYRLLISPSDANYRF